jgi:hypothetical protein
MKTKISILVLILSMLETTGFSQVKTRRESREQKKLEKQIQIEALVNSKEFVFVPRTALPSGMSPVNLSINQNYIKFRPELINSYMPFFGNANSGVVFSTDKGLKFIGKPELFTVEKNKNSYQLYAVVKGETDNFRLSLSV